MDLGFRTHEHRELREMTQSYSHRAQLVPTEDPDLEHLEACRPPRKWSEDSAESGCSTTTAGSEAVAAKTMRTISRRQVAAFTAAFGGVLLLCCLGAGTYGGLHSANVSHHHPLLAFLWPAQEPEVDTSAFRYDPNVTSVVTQLARAAFCSPTANWTCTPCRASGVKIQPGALQAIHGDEVLDDDSTFLYVAKMAEPESFAGKCVVAFRGTRNFDNTITDLEWNSAEVPASWKCKGCHAHAGYLQTLVQVEEKLMAAIQDSGCSRTEGIVMAGHSMGAALATLAAWLLQEKHSYKLTTVYAFESPRVVDVAFAKEFDEKVGKRVPTWRLTHYPDLVPFLPLESVAFMHVQREVFFHKHSTTPILCDGVDDKKCMMGHPVPLLTFKDEHCRLPYVEDNGDTSRGNMCACKR
mmetsp:Transcript_17905/g.41753  ORF Transcript_17905/g.41753 Transcript_17905/m.41753 type:complete len:410 (-) Transcript_17905:45-1274(-)